MKICGFKFNPKDTGLACERIKWAVKDLDPEKQLVVTVETYSQKRSLNANSYMWSLCDEIACFLHDTKVNVYLDAIHEVGIWRDFHDQTEEDVKSLITAWGMIGTGWFAERLDYEPDGVHVCMRAYYGSSVYNTNQMSRLIDYIVDQAKNCDIETMTPKELSLLKEAWHG